MIQDDRSLLERVQELEKLCATQRGQIEAAMTTLSDLLAAHLVLRKDVRLLRFLDERLTNDRNKIDAGGTQRIPSSFFEARFFGFAEILERVWLSPVFDRYWFQSIFFRRERRQRDELAKIRAIAEEMVNRHNL